MPADTEVLIETLQVSLQETLSSYDSAHELLQLNGEIINETGPLSQDRIHTGQSLKKKFILDSFKVSKVQKEYKEWEHSQTDSFIKNEITAYNKTVSESARLNIKIDTLTEQFEELNSTVHLPRFTFSIQTLLKFGDEKLLEYLEKDEDGEYPSTVEVDQLFSVDSKSNLPFPDYKVFYDLVNLEYRLRAEKRIKYEILVLIRNQIALNNTKWATRDNYLSDFLKKQIPTVIGEIESIKTSEAENKEESEESEDEQEEIIEQEIEEEEEEENEPQEEGHPIEEEEEVELDSKSEVSHRSSRREIQSDSKPTETEVESEDDMLIDA
ncbi:uncharacterized protein RJT20DRAFT_143194 [Scheffersomyces xylosifermentans]|uniref:uncharacterized protein n=1 Tax=Scheffersomyces xylosifermentans TaxID=1304137 RepID=UPI00315D73F3